VGLLDLPAPLLSTVDDWLAPVLPPAARLVLWAAVAALLCMELYRLLSPQERIADTRLALADSRQRLDRFDGEFHDAWPHMRQTLGLALRRIGLVLPATFAASLPLLVLIVWTDNRYGPIYPPPDAAVSVQVPGAYEGRWVGGAGGVPHARVVDRAGNPVAEVPVAKPAAVIHKRRWWNALISNPAGYLSDALPFDRIDISMARRQILPVGPDWIRGWEPLFFAAMVAFALAFKTVRRIE
jgi:hypothetical protein